MRITLCRYKLEQRYNDLLVYCLASESARIISAVCCIVQEHQGG